MLLIPDIHWWESRNIGLHTHGLVTRQSFTYRVMRIPKTHVCGVVKTRMHVRGTPPFPESRCVLCVITATLRHESKQAPCISPHDWRERVITAANYWSHVLRLNCNKSSVHWTYRRTFPAPPVTTAFHTGMTCGCKPTFSEATFEWDTLYMMFCQVWTLIMFHLQFLPPLKAIWTSSNVVSAQATVRYQLHLIILL
jgi:hypothetical protein